MLSLLRSPTVLKLLKYSTASASGVVLGLATLNLFYSVLDWPALAANLASVTVGCVPNYLINRYWTWQQTGANRFWGEVVPFWVMAALGAFLSFFAVAYADDRWGTPIAVSLAQLSGFGILWMARFLILDKLMWKVIEDTHPEVDIDAAEAGMIGALDLDAAQEAAKAEAAKAEAARAEAARPTDATADPKG